MYQCPLWDIPQGVQAFSAVKAISAIFIANHGIFPHKLFPRKNS